MLDKIKAKANSILAALVVICVGVTGTALYLLHRKGKDIELLKAQIALVETQKQADIIEAQINERKRTRATLKIEIDALNKVGEELEQKRKQIAAEQQGKSADEIEQYWRIN